MNIKVNNQYLDFNEDIDIERQVKLFEEVGDSVGDVSFDFVIPGTSRNRGILSIYSIDQNNKSIYTNIPTVLENGAPVYYGFIKVERDRGDEIDCNFYSGNSDLWSLLDFKLKEFDFSKHNVEWTLTSISSRESATTGIIFPVINTGAMTTRSYSNWHLDDLHPFVYVDTIIKTLLNSVGVKLQGNILQDWRYNHLITSNNRAGLPQEEINDRSTSVGKTTDQVITTTPAKVTFHLESDPYFTGDLWSTANDRYTADYRMLVDITVNIDQDAGSEFMHYYIYKNGSLDMEIFGDTATAVNSKTIKDYVLEPSDYIEMYSSVEAGTGTIFSYYLTITPTRIYNVFTDYLLPDVTAKEFVADVFGLFNTVVNFNGLTRVADVNLFASIIRKPELDISEYVEGVEADYSELMENYGRLNNFLYSDGSTEELEKYNNNNILPFGSGQLDSGFEVGAGTAPVIESLFIATIESNKNPLDTYLPHLDWRSLSESSLRSESVSITNSGGLLFTASGYSVGDLVRITNSTNNAYEGEYIVSSATSTTFRVAGLSYIGNATADVTKLEIVFENNDEQALLLALPNISLGDFTKNSLLFYADSSAVSAVSTPATAYFYKPTQGLNIDNYKESLSFGPMEIRNAHQITMLESYWRDFENILTDPVKIRAEAHFPLTVFNRLFDGPLRIKTAKFNSRFFMNKVTGYKTSYKPCEIEAVKL